MKAYPYIQMCGKGKTRWPVTRVLTQLQFDILHAIVHQFKGERITRFTNIQAIHELVAWRFLAIEENMIGRNIAFVATKEAKKFLKEQEKREGK